MPLHLALIALAVLLATPHGVVAGTRTIVVTSTEDERARNKPAPAGSLREAVELLAEPGDTITFQVAGPVVLKAPLRILSGLTGLTIQGPATISGGARGVIDIPADNVTLQNLRLENIHVFGGKDGFDTIGIRVLDNLFAGDSSVMMTQVQACHVVQNRFDVTRRSDVIAFDRTTGCRIGANVITSPGRWQIDDASSEGLVIEQNRLNGAIWSRQRSGEVRNNILEGTERLWVLPSDFPPSGLVRVANNRAPAIFVQRTNVQVVGNTLEPVAEGTGPRAPLHVVNFEPSGPAGDVLVELNEVRGGKVGIRYDETATSAPGMVRRNLITNCLQIGMLVGNAVSARIERNEVRDCGTTTAGAGIAIRAAQGSEVVADANIILRTLGVGILVVDPADRVTLTANEIRQSAAAGIEVQGGPGRVVMGANTVVNNTGPGVEVRRQSRASLVGDAIANNGSAGVLVFAEAIVAVSRVSMHGNAGPGIDIAPSGVTDNPKTKRGNLDIDWPEHLVWHPDRLEGDAAPGSLVEVYVVEDGARAGNPRNGEGQTYLGSAVADAAGHFVYPLPCTPGTVLTTTATLPADHPPTAATSHTSEFSTDVTCTLAPPPPPDPDPPTCAPTDPQEIVVGEDVHLIVPCEGGTTPYQVEETTGLFPNGEGTGSCAGLTLGVDGHTVIFGGSPTTAGTCAGSFEVSDSSVPTRTHAFPLRFDARLPLEILTNSGALRGGDVNTEYEDAILTFGGSGVFTWAVVDGVLPPGLTLAPAATDSSIGRITGRPTLGGYFTPTIEVRDSLNPSQVARREFFIPILEIATTEIPDAVVGQPYQTAIESRGQVHAVWTAVDDLPPGLDFGGFEEAGYLGGTLTQVGTFTFTVRARSGRGVEMSDTEQLTLVVKPSTVGVVAAISVSTDGAFDNGRPDLVDWGAPAITPNGRYVAFVSNGTNLVPGLTTAKNRVYLRDTCINAPLGCIPSTILISEPREGATEADVSFAEFPSISANGRHVLFFGRGKYAPYLNASFLDRSVQAFVRDTCYNAPAGCVPRTVTLPERPALDEAGNQVLARGQRVTPALRAMSADGRFVLLPSACLIDTDLVCPDLPLDGSVGLILHDRDADEDGVFDEDGETTNHTIRVVPDGVNPIVLSRIFMNPDGKFFSYLGTRGVPALRTLFVQRLLGTGDRDEITDSRYRLGAEWNGPLSGDVAILGDTPRFYWAYSSANAGPTLPDYREDAFRAECVSSPTCDAEPMSRDDGGVSANDGRPSDRTTDISTRARFVSFTTFGGNLDASDTNDTQDVYVYDTCLVTFGCVEERRRVSLKSNGEELQGGAYNHVLSGNGQYVVFANNGIDTDILPDGNPATPQLYIASTGFSEQDQALSQSVVSIKEDAGRASRQR